MMTYRVSGLDWCVIDTRRILAGPFPTARGRHGRGPAADDPHMGAGRRQEGANRPPAATS